MSDTFELNPITRLSRDLRRGAATLGDREARYLVDTFYIMQEDRKRSKAQKRALEDNEEPHEVLGWLFDQFKSLEDQIQVALDFYTQNHKMGSWMRGVYGIGPVLSAGLLAHIDIKQCPTVGHIYNFAGLNPGAVWLGSAEATKVVTALVGNARLTRPGIIQAAKDMGADPKWLARRIYKLMEGKDFPFLGVEEETTDEKYVEVVIADRVVTKKRVVEAVSKRPWNADLKTLCWKVGKSFQWFHNKDECFYGKLYKERKEKEQALNELGHFKDEAAKGLNRVGADTDAHKFYSQGKLPPARIDLRATRYATKIFLSHLHEEWFRREFGREPPKPYAIAIKGHAHYIPPPQ